MIARVILLEDSEDDTLLVVEALRAHGFQLEWEWVETPENLRRTLAEGPWDAVLCDYKMPLMTAEDAVEIVRSHDSNLPFILVSGTVDASVAVTMMRKGMHEYVMKDELLRLGPAVEREIRDSRHRQSEMIAKAELFALQKRFRDTFEQSSVGIAHLDREGRVTWLNQQLADMLGYDRDDLIGIPCEKLTWPEDWPEEQQRQRELLDGSATEFRVPKRYRRIDGTPIWTLLTLTAIRNDQGELSYLSAVVQDISDQKRAEDQLRSSETFTRAILDSLPFQVAVIDNDGVVRHVNDAWENFARANGLTSLDSVGVGTSYLDVCSTDLREDLDGVINGETSSFALEYPCHSPEEERWFLMKAAPLAGSEHGAVISHVDITERVLTEQALERSEREYRSILETMGEGLISLDAEERLLFANRRFLEMVGYDLEELRGESPIEIIVVSEERERVKAQVERTRHGEPVAFEAHCRRKDGTEIWLAASTVPRLDSAGNIVGRLSVITDITEKRAAEQEQDRLRKQIEELNRIESLGKLAGTMAHEFNNVLMGVQPFTEVIRRATEENQKIQQATQYIADAVNRGRRISQEILRFARPTPPERSEIGIGALLAQIEQNARGIVNSKHALVVDPYPEEASVRIDREQLVQVFTNLMLNACDAMEPGGKIRVAAGRDDAPAHYDFGVVDNSDDYIHFEVSDTGCGMAPDVANKIFEPMFTTKRTGTGLGLAIVHQIITAHEGYVFVDSREGEGTTFHLFLPLSGRRLDEHHERATTDVPR